MKIVIVPASNGYTMSIHCEGEPIERRVYSQKDDDFGATENREHVQQMLYEIINTLGETGSRYDKARLVVRFEEGDKYEEPVARI